MWRQVSFSLAKGDDLCDIPDDFSTNLKLTRQYRYVECARTLPPDVVAHCWSFTVSTYITIPFNSRFCVLLVLESNRDNLRERQISSGLLLLQVQVEVMPLGHTSSHGLCDIAPPMSRWSPLGGRTGRPSNRFYVQTLELYQSTTQPYQRRLAQTKHLDS